MRFNQDCIFTPVSAQTQAFVPAHTVWRGVGPAPAMYGAYGQPLQQQAAPSPHAEYAVQPPPRQPQYLPSPTAASGPYQAHSTYPSPPAAPHDVSRDATSRKRQYAEPHTPTLPPPRPTSASQLSHRSAGSEYSYSDPTSLTSAVSPAPSSSAYPAPPATEPYYTHQPRRSSPPSSYSTSASSPHGSHTATSPYYAAPPAPNGLSALPPRNDGRTPPPPTTQAPSTSRPSMRITDLVSDNGNGRSSTDSSMLNMLNRRPM